MDKEKLSVSLPSAAKWEQQRASFKTTVGSDVPAPPYGEESGTLKSLCRRLVRKSVRWYAEALITEQNKVNRQLSERLEQLERRVAELEAEKKP